MSWWEMADWQTEMAGSSAGFEELMDDGLGRMVEEGIAIISCQARCWSVTIWGTATKRQAVIEGDGEVGREREGSSVGEQPQSPAQGVGSCTEGCTATHRAGQPLSSYVGASLGSCLSRDPADSWACRTGCVS